MRSGRTRTLPPFGAAVGLIRIRTLAAQIWAFCAPRAVSGSSKVTRVMGPVGMRIAPVVAAALAVSCDRAADFGQYVR